MQAITTPTADTSAPQRAPLGAAPASSAFAGYQIIRRNGAVVVFEPSKIAVALMKAFLAVHGTQGAASASVRETVDALTEAVVRSLLRSRPGGGAFARRWNAATISPSQRASPAAIESASASLSSIWRSRTISHISTGETGAAWKPR